MCPDSYIMSCKVSNIIYIEPSTSKATDGHVVILKNLTIPTDKKK